MKNNNEEEKPKDNKKQNRQDAAQKRVQLAPLTKVIKSLETHMEKYQTRLDEVRSVLAGSEIYEADKKSQLQKLLTEEVECKAKLEDLEMQWFEKQEELHAMESEN